MTLTGTTPGQEVAAVERLGVIGCGLMGAGIAEVMARAGGSVIVVESSEQAADAGRLRIERSLVRAEARGGVDSASEVLERISVVTDMEMLEDRELVVEAAAEDLDIKVRLFARLDEVLRDGQAVMASNTSSIPIMKLGMATTRPQSVVGMHFFNPVPVLSLVEIVPSLLTSARTTARARAYAEEQLGKTAIASQDRPGFVVNALLVPFLLSSIRMLEIGVASAEDIDRGLVLGAAHPQGPLALADLIGLDTLQSVAESLYGELKDPAVAPPSLLYRMVEAGRLGRKTGRGFHDYG